MDTTQQEVAIDKQKVAAILAQFELPPEIVRVDTNYGKDHTGDPAVFLTFHLHQGVHASREEIKPISRFVHRVAATLLNGNIGGFPYTRLKQAA